MSISIKTKEELETMRRAGKLLAEVMVELGKIVRPGINTWQVDQLAEKLILARGAEPAFKGYGDKKNPFPATICASVNNEIVHGIPNENKILNEGDIFKIDIGLKIDGYFSDMARTFAVGKISAEAQKLIEVTEKTFWQGVKLLKDGVYLSEFSKKAQQVAEKAGFSVVRDLTGHGIGRNLHEEPQVLNYFEPFARDVKLQKGMVLAFEPMINAGGYQTILGKDGWVFQTADGKLSAHYENTVIITQKGVEVITMKKQK
jgi:methionyl aminopeptidase